LLIHESTFEDGMEDEAVLKRHCTVGEALMVGKRMRAKAVVLTHFSQRYPRIPPLREGASETRIGGSNPDDEYHPRIVFAFDFMKLTPSTVAMASALTPAMRLLYPCEKESNSPDGEDEEIGGEPSVTTAEILAVPGLFAQQGLL
jgi:ribonuclease Z